MRNPRFVLALVAVLAACEGPQGPAGPPGPPGPAGGTADAAPTPDAPRPDAGPVVFGPVGEGLIVEIVSATAPASGPPTVTFTVTDNAGRPIDFLTELKAGRFGATRGPRFSIAQAAALGGTYDQNLYETANAGDPGGRQTRPTSVPGNITTAQAAELYVRNADGSYTFTFPTEAPALPALASGFPLAPDPAKQTLVAIHAARTFDNVTYPYGASYELVPSGGAVTPRQVVSDAACNNCHKNLTAHGTRRTVNLCLTCHTPGWTQAAGANNTKNAIDFRVMVHQIHRGQQPTDVQNAEPWVYKWSATNDFSEVEFAPPNTVRNCVACHQGGEQSDGWKTRPSRVACGSCHYAVNFDTGAGHLAGPQATDNQCASCHAPEVDGLAPSITKVHSFLYDALTNTTFQGVDLQIVINSVNVTNPAAGTVTFTVQRNGQPADIKAAGQELSNLRFTVAGPTSDYGGPNGPAPSTGVLNHTPGFIQSQQFGGANGAALLTATGTPGQFTAPLPDLARAMNQSVGVAVEAYILEEGTCPAPPCAEREWAEKGGTPVVYARVGGGNATARRAITDAEKCNVCHVDLGFHGGEARKGPDYCAMCHNSANVNDERTSQFEAPFEKTPHTVQLAIMIHKIHKGDEVVPSGSLPSPRPIYTLGVSRDFRADPATGRAEGEADEAMFTHQFPGDIKDCQTCHKPGGYGLPEPTVLPTRQVTFECLEAPDADANQVCGTLSGSGGVVAPDTAAGDAFWRKTERYIGSAQAHCGSCHDSAPAQAHIDVNTAAGVESCDVCHGDGRFMDPIEIHLPRP
jgi:OmcA/MtrC family decaheme c-type cytochrome